ncbi:hypothetical protein ACIA4Q_08700 [Lactobacillus delbrueckii subsp. bulgaricus]
MLDDRAFIFAQINYLAELVEDAEVDFALAFFAAFLVDFLAVLAAFLVDFLAVLAAFLVFLAAFLVDFLVVLARWGVLVIKFLADFRQSSKFYLQTVTITFIVG